MPDDILRPEAGGNPRAAQTRIRGRSAGAIGGQRAHDLRIGPQPDYVDAGRSGLNRVLVAPQTGTRLRKTCEERRARRQTARAMKSSAAVGIVGILTFGHEAQRIFAALTAAQQDAAYREAAEAIAARLNTTLTGLVVHADESAPHAHYQMPAYDLAGHPISETAKRGVLRELQTLTAEVMGRHAPGIERGRSKLDRLRAGAAPAEVVNRSVAQLHDDLPAEIAAKEARIAALDEQIGKNTRLAARALQKAAEDEARADKAQKNAALYESRAEKARQERAEEERALSALQKARHEAEARLAGLRQHQGKLAAEVAELEATAARLQAEAGRQKAHIARAEQIADAQRARIIAAEAEMRAVEAMSRAAEGEAAGIRDKALREAQEAADAILAQARIQGAQTAHRITGELSRRLEQQLLSEGQQALHRVERERDQWRAAFRLLRGVVKGLLPANLYRMVRGRFAEHWSSHPDNPDRQPEPASPDPSGPPGP